MQICKNCSYENSEGEMFCVRCGVALSAVSVATSQLGEMNGDLAAGGAYMSDDHVLFLHFANHPDPIAIQLDQELILGRESGEGRLNIDQYDAIELGVSRQHASLFAVNKQVFARDLGSTNHTFVNGEKLAVGRDYPLRDGDELTLGRMVIKIFFK